MGKQVKNPKSSDRSSQRYQELQTIFDSLPVMIWCKDKCNKIIRCNKLAAAIRGLTVAEMENRYTEEFYPDEAAMYLADDLEVINSGEQKLGIVELHQTASGEKIWVRTDKIPYQDEDGNIIGVIVFALDITQLKHTEEELVRSFSLLQAALESTADGLMIMDKAGKIVKFNRKFLDMWQISNDVLTTQASREILTILMNQLTAPHDFLSKISHPDIESRAEDFTIIEFKDGKVFECYSQPQQMNGKSVGRVWSFRDVTIRKWSERFLTVQHAVTRILVQSNSLEDAAARIVQVICESLKFSIGVVWRVDRDAKLLRCVDIWHKSSTQFTELASIKQRTFALGVGLPGRIWLSGEPESRFDLRQHNRQPLSQTVSIEPQIVTFEKEQLGEGGFPILHGNKILGVIGICRPEISPPHDGLLKMMNDIGHQIGQFIDRKQAEEQLRTSSEQLRRVFTHLQTVREEERTSIAREIHDELGQNLTALGMDITWLYSKLPKEPLLLEKIKGMSRLVDTIIESVQRISTELRPSILDNLGLIAAIEWQMREFITRTGIDCRLLNRVGNISINQPRTTAVFRVFQEAMTNIARHANANKVKLSLRESHNYLILEINDNGRGITEQQIAEATSLGLIGMRERVIGLGGDILIKGTAGKGTIVRVKMPLEAGS